ncbi:hypothetical protein U9M48_020155 [Paspalum notatum var. saurae]|uniref:Uncharacterized protein n=1 Tax=Paspalum notatum var. saurae TaxID=547442 RepID=A0AAQ3TDX0_PASNO
MNMIFLLYLVVFLRQFQTFEDKSAAISADNGVNQQLADMIEHWYLPGMKLGVAKPEYKTIIESKLGITCMHNEAVMEAMWGIEQLMHILVPDEKAELTKEDRLPMSQGLQMLLSRYGFDVELEMINKRIIVTAQTLCACEVVEHEFLRPLRNDALILKAISGINCEHWDALKLATALMMFSSFREEIDSYEVLTQDELSKLKIVAHKYKDIAFKCNCLMYKKLASAYKIKLAKKKLLGSLVKKARKAEVRKKGKLHGDPQSQIPQEHVQGELQRDSEQLPQEHVKDKLQETRSKFLKSMSLLISAL